MGSSFEKAASLEDLPRAQIESQLRECWKAAFQVQKVDLYDDFFAVGGNSIIADRFIALLRERAGIELSNANVYQARNIAHIADLVLMQRDRSVNSVCIPIRSRGSLPPLFMIHGVGGNILGFYNLVKHLPPDRPVYGIQAQGLLPNAPALIHLEEQAAYYLKEIRRIQPHGPYNFLGFSFGGLVAYEIAQQLLAEGESVGLLGMLDTRQIRNLGHIPSPKAFVKHIWIGSAKILRHTKRFNLPNKFLMLANIARRRLLRLSYQYSSAGGKRTIADSLKSVHDINMNAALNYKVQPYDGHITLFRAMDESEWNLPEDLGWGASARQGVEIHKIPSGHGQICMEPHVDLLASKVSEGLARANMQIHIA